MVSFCLLSEEIIIHKYGMTKMKGQREIESKHGNGTELQIFIFSTPHKREKREDKDKTTLDRQTCGGGLNRCW
jgi:hypothetical protein